MIDELIKKYSLISDQIEKDELKVILQKLNDILDSKIDGAIIEMGCFVGTTSLFISRLLKLKGSDKEFHVYDSFSGLPEKSEKDLSPAGEQFKPGELYASKKQFIENYKKSALPLPIIHKNWFESLSDSDIPTPISFAFLDGDYYSSIKSSLDLITNKLTPGSIVIIDDYQNEALPGAKKSTDEWAKIHNLDIQTINSLAIINIPRR